MIDRTITTQITDKGVSAALMHDGTNDPWGFKTDCVNIRSDHRITKVEVDGVLYWYIDNNHLSAKITLCDKIGLDELTMQVGPPAGVTIEKPSLPVTNIKVWCNDRCSRFTWSRNVPPIDQQIPNGIKID